MSSESATPANPGQATPDLNPADLLETGYRESGVLRISLRTAAILLCFTLIFTALMAGTFHATAPMLEASAQTERLRLIGEVLPRTLYDNDLLADFVRLPPGKRFGQDTETQLYRARKNGEPVALVMEIAALDGYSGRIGLILAIDTQGRLIAQRVTSHRETPGLGDYIDPKKDKNKTRPWITQFNGQGPGTLPMKEWRVKKDGGRFDQMAGATISARAITNASGRALDWANTQKDHLFALPVGQIVKDAP